MKNLLFRKEIISDRDLKTLAACCLLITCFSTLMSVVNIITDNMGMAAITGGIAIWFLLNLIIYYIFKKKTCLILALMAGIYIVMMYFVISGGVGGFSIVWLLVVPPAVQYCLNSHYGVLFSLFLGISLAIYLWTPLNQLGYSYSETYLVRFPLVYFFATFLSIVMHYRISKYRSEQETLIEHLASASQTKNDFLANMSHEIRTPMNAIVGMCELILRDDINEDVRENCFNIQNSSRSLLSIINDILNFSKIEAGKIELIEEPFNLASTVNDVLNMAMTRKGDKNIEIIARVDPTIPKGLIGDELRIRQIIINLLTNAVKFTQTGCVVLKITQSRHDYGINLNVSVKDTGIGISEENIEKLFTSFQQVDTRKNRAVEGTGLGLAISKRLIAKMGGFINVFSTYGEGSEFKFVIPLKVSDPEPFIQLNTADKVKVAVYLDWKKYDHPRISRSYQKLIRELGSKLKVDFTMFDTFEDLKQEMETGTYTHCFVAKQEYTEHTEYFNAIADEYQMIVVQDRFHAAPLPDKIKKVYKPFYALTFAAIINNEKYILDIGGRKNFSVRFIAPEAKVLIVDDNATNLKVAAGLMKPYNMKIITVSSGPEAIDAIKTQDYDIIFMDHMMPEMDGVEATQIIRNMAGAYYQRVPIIALTANAVSGAREMFLGNGFNDFLAKPIEISVLDRVLRSWLPQERVITASTKVAEEDALKATEAKEPTPTQAAPAGPVNYEKGLRYVGGSEETYLDILKVYVSSSKEYRAALLRHFDAKNWTNYTVEAHALKSSSFSVGAETLSELAKKLELAGKDGRYDVILKEHEALITLYDTVIQDASEYLAENGCLSALSQETAPQDLTDITFEVFLEDANAILTACEDFDGDSVIELCEKLCSCKVNNEPLTDFFADVKQCADDYDYDQAIELTKKAIETIKGANV